MVTVGVLAWQRDEDTAKAVRSVFQQPYRPIDVVLVDASPGHRISHQLQPEFPDLRVFRMHKNLGCPGGRNVIFANASGEYVLNIDDDCTIESGTVGEIVRVMKSDQSVGVVACNIVEQYCAQEPVPKGGPVTEVFQFRGVSALRRSILNEVGYYPDDFLRQGEETHLALRVLDKGYRIVIAPEAVVNHFHSPVGRNDQMRVFYTTRNELQTVAELAPWSLFAPLLFYKTVILAFAGIRYRAPLHFLAGFAAFLYRFPRLLGGHRRTSVKPWSIYLRERVQKARKA
jgi:GT2 family glycosyltransferase